MFAKKIKRKIAYRILSVLIAIVIFMGSANGLRRIGVFAESIKDVELQKEQAQKDAEELQKAKKELMDSLGDMDIQLYQISEEVNSLSDSIEQLEQGIAEKEAELLTLEEKSKNQYENMKLRIQYLYENGGTFSWTSIFSSGSFADALSKVEYAIDLASTDRRLLEEYKNTLDIIQTEKVELEDQKTQLLANRTLADQQKVALLDAIDVTKNDISETEQLITDKETDILEFEEQIAAMEEYERKLEEERAKKAAEEQAKKKEEEEKRKKEEEEKKKKEEEEKKKAEEEAKKDKTDSEETEIEESDNGEGNVETNDSSLSQEDTVADSPDGYWLHTTTPVDLTEEEKELFAALVYCEAGGESYETQHAVASVVVNRINSSKYPDTLIDVIYQKSQFSPAASGRLMVVLEKGFTTESCRKAVNEAIAGNICGDWLHFCYNFGTIDGDVIGSEVFY